MEYKIKNTFNPLSLDSVAFEGEIGGLFNRFIENRMLSDFAVENILKEAEDAFFEKLDDANAPIGTWRGEFWGKLIISASRTAKYLQSEKLKEIVANSCEKIISAADENGYIGSYKDPSIVFACPLEEGRKIKGWDCDWCWNIWCRKYTLWGLLEAYELLKDQKILDAAIRTTNQLLDLLDERGINIFETGTFNGIASASILKPMLILYRLTDNERYLNFALKIAQSAQDDEAKCMKPIKNALSLLPIHLWNCNDKEEPSSSLDATSHKAYETMSFFDGVLELYRITGEEKCLKAGENFWELLMKYELNPLMSVGFNDLFLFARAQQNAASEPCDVIHFMRLSSELFKLTGKHKYIDVFELTFENAMVASIFRDGAWGSRILRGSSHHVSAPPQCDLKYNHCCVNNAPRGFLNAAEMIVSSNNDEAYINLYTPSKISENGLKIDISKGYIENQKLTVDVTSEKELYINFRLPSWSRTVIINGTEYTSDNGYVKQKISSGNSCFTLEFDHNLRIVKPKSTLLVHTLTDYMERRLINPRDEFPAFIKLKNDKVTLFVGPLLLAKSKLSGCALDEIFADTDFYHNPPELTIEPIENDQLRATFKIKGQNIDINVGDYAFSSNLNEEKLFSIYF